MKERKMQARTYQQNWRQFQFHQRTCVSFSLSKACVHLFIPETLASTNKLFTPSYSSMIQEIVYKIFLSSKKLLGHTYVPSIENLTSCREKHLDRANYGLKKSSLLQKSFLFLHPRKKRLMKTTSNCCCNTTNHREEFSLKHSNIPIPSGYAIKQVEFWNLN